MKFLRCRSSQRRSQARQSGRRNRSILPIATSSSGGSVFGAIRRAHRDRDGADRVTSVEVDPLTAWLVVELIRDALSVRRRRRDAWDGTDADDLRSRHARPDVEATNAGGCPRVPAGSCPTSSAPPQSPAGASVGAPFGAPTHPIADLSTTPTTSYGRATESGGTASAVTSEITSVSPRTSYQRCLTQPTGSRPTTVMRSKVVPSHRDHGDDHPPPAVEQGKTAAVVATRPALRGIAKEPPPALRGRARRWSCGRHELGRRGRQRRTAPAAEPAGRVVLLPARRAASGLDRLGGWRPTGRLWRRRRWAGGRGRRPGDVHWRDRRWWWRLCVRRLDPDPTRPTRGRCRRTHRMSTQRGCVHHRQRTGLPSPRCPRFGSVHSPQYLASLTCVQRTCGMGG